MKRYLILCLLTIVPLLTGCPHNEYTVELKPQGQFVERTLAFHREDEGKIEEFPSDELAAVSKLYTNGVKRNGNEYAATGVFSETMPGDVGGAGSFANAVTSMGTVGFYMERFRGDDDLAGMMERRFQAADQMTDLLIGWSKAELGKEPHYAELRQFIDMNLRRDLKNLAAYVYSTWQADVTRARGLSEEEQKAVSDRSCSESIARFLQYLAERGYVNVAELPDYMVLADDNNGMYRFAQRLVAEKMGVKKSEPLPKALAFLGEEGTAEKSFLKYFVGTDYYRSELSKAKEKAKLNPGETEKEPKPEEVAAQLFMKVTGIEFTMGDTDDHVVVKLNLASAPIYTNGKWDEAKKQLNWQSTMQKKENAFGLPVFCYAAWCDPDEGFQKEHFGKIVLRGDGLTEYCMWRTGLELSQGDKWDTMLGGLQPGKDGIETLKNFDFGNGTAQNALPLNKGRELILEGLQEKPAETK